MRITILERTGNGTRKFHRYAPKLKGLACSSEFVGSGIKFKFIVQLNGAGSSSLNGVERSSAVRCHPADPPAAIL